jgi:acyl-homoserine lactone acylase PvdQ
MISTGESGNLFSLHVDDLMRLWARGTTVTITTDPRAIQAATAHRFELRPVQTETPSPAARQSR